MISSPEGNAAVNISLSSVCLWDVSAVLWLKAGRVLFTELRPTCGAECGYAFLCVKVMLLLTLGGSVLGAAFAMDCFVLWRNLCCCFYKQKLFTWTTGVFTGEAKLISIWVPTSLYNDGSRLHLVYEYLTEAKAVHSVIINCLKRFKMFKTVYLKQGCQTINLI